MAQADLLQSLNQRIAEVERALAELRAHIAHLRDSNQDTKEAEARLHAITTLQREQRKRREAIQRARKPK